MQEYDAPAGWSPPRPPPAPIEVCSHGDTPLGLCLRQAGEPTGYLRTEQGFHADTLLVEVLTEHEGGLARSGIVLDRTGITALRELLDRALASMPSRD